MTVRIYFSRFQFILPGYSQYGELEQIVWEYTPVFILMVVSDVR